MRLFGLEMGPLLGRIAQPLHLLEPQSPHQVKGAGGGPAAACVGAPRGPLLRNEGHKPCSQDSCIQRARGDKPLTEMRRTRPMTSLDPGDPSLAV